MIGLYAPYSWREETEIALSLCELAQELGHDVSYLSYQAHEHGIDCVWDRKVQDGRKKTFGSWMQDCKHIVWFDCQRDKLLRARHAGKSNTLVFVGTSLKAENIPLLDLFDNIVFFNPFIDRQLPALPEARLVIMPWAPAETKPVRKSRLDPDRIFSLIWINKYTACYLRGEIFSAMQLAFEAEPMLSVRLVGSKNWSRPAKILLQDLLHRWTGRLQLVSRPSRQRWAELLGSSDVMMSLSSREAVGTAALSAAHSGLPVVGFAASPLSGFINPSNGWLIPCEVKGDGFGIVSATAEASSILGAFTSCKDNLEMVYSGNSNFCAGERRNVFRDNWQKIWE